MVKGLSEIESFLGCFSLERDLDLDTFFFAGEGGEFEGDLFLLESLGFSSFFEEASLSNDLEGFCPLFGEGEFYGDLGFLILFGLSECDGLRGLLPDFLFGLSEFEGDLFLLPCLFDFPEPYEGWSIDFCLEDLLYF